MFATTAGIVALSSNTLGVFQTNNSFPARKVHFVPTKDPSLAVCSVQSTNNLYPVGTTSLVTSKFTAHNSISPAASAVKVALYIVFSQADNIVVHNDCVANVGIDFLANIKSAVGAASPAANVSVVGNVPTAIEDHLDFETALAAYKANFN